MSNAFKYFENDFKIVENSLKAIDENQMSDMISQCAKSLNDGHKIIVSDLGKNVPICEKFVGTMISLGLNAEFLHTNTAVHGDMGMVHSGDIVIILTKSGSTTESVYLTNLLKRRDNVKLWLMSCNKNGILAETLENKLIVPLEHEGDLWDIVPNNSTTLFLIILQTLAMKLAKKQNITLADFKANHPGGAIGEKLRNE